MLIFIFTIVNSLLILNLYGVLSFNFLKRKRQEKIEEGKIYDRSIFSSLWESGEEEPRLVHYNDVYKKDKLIKREKRIETDEEYKQRMEEKSIEEFKLMSENLKSENLDPLTKRAFEVIRILTKQL